MVDSPEKLSAICLRKFAALLKSDQRIWKQQISESIERTYREAQQHGHLQWNDRQRRKHHRGEPCQVDEQSVDDASSNILNRRDVLFLDTFLRGLCPLNATLSERLVNYLVRHDQLNDFTLTLFSPTVTFLKRLVINVKYLSRLSCHVLRQHPNLLELEITFKDSNPYRTILTTNEVFDQHICPSIHSTFEQIYTTYGPYFLRHTYPSASIDIRRPSASNQHPLQRLNNSSDEFSHHKLLNSILCNLHPLTIERLRVLSLAHYKFFAATHTTPARKYSVADMSPLTKCSTSVTSTMTTPANSVPTNLRLILKLTNLTSLNLSATDIKDPCLEIIIDSLEHLDTLDLSCCSSITSFHALVKLSSNLKWLNLYNCALESQRNPSIYQILSQLTSLEYLDISNDNSFNDTNALHSLVDNSSEINLFLRHEHCLPRLKHLDLSGRTTISSVALHRFLLNHWQLQFLGLFLTHEKYSSCLFDSNDVCYWKYRRYTYDLHHILTLTVTEQDLILYEPYLIEALTRYQDRASFVQKILYYVFFLTRSFPSKQQQYLLELILGAMATHSTLQSVQMASTACIYNMTRAPINEQIHVKCLAQLVQATMNVMSTFPNHKQLQKNCLLTLCSDRILHEPNFDFYLLATLVMNNLQNYTDLAIIQPGVAILSLLTTRLTIGECTQLGSLVNIKRLLQLIERQTDRLQSTQIPPGNLQQNDQTGQAVNEIDIVIDEDAHQLTSDDTLRFCLSLLWNLTDENPVVCEIFIHSTGLPLFQRLLNLFASDMIVLTKIVGVLSNVAEVSHLKLFLYSIDVVPLMQRYLSQSILDVAFSAAGILAHLLSEQADSEIDWQLCEDMREVILTWQNPHTNMVTYRSFQPFFPLLFCTRIPVVQLWAIWAIHHVCSTDRARYGRLVREEKLYDVMQTLYRSQMSSEHPDQSIVYLLKSLLQLLKSYQVHRHERSSAVGS